MFFLLSSTSGILLSTAAHSWEFNMFSFFTKKDITTPTTIHSAIGHQLVELSSYSKADTANGDSNTSSCQKVKVQGQPPRTLSPADNSTETYEAGFIVESELGDIALINNPDEFRFDLWSLASDDKLALDQKILTKPLSPEADNWVNYSVANVACLPNNKLLLAVNYYDPRPKIALYLYDLSDKTFTFFAHAEANAQDLYKYFEQKSLSNTESMIVYYSDTKRKSAEIYHNYYNHIVLFNDQFPEGIELVKLGIDNGNIIDWQLNHNKLQLHTRDNREHKSPHIRYLSLDISKMLNQ
jgi:hypothetical protein